MGDETLIAGGVYAEIAAELERAAGLGFSLFNSAHEDYAVLLEEVDELKAEVWKKPGERDYVKMRAEAVQVAAMAVNFIKSLDAA